MRVIKYERFERTPFVRITAGALDLWSPPGVDDSRLKLLATEECGNRENSYANWYRIRDLFELSKIRGFWHHFDYDILRHILQNCDLTESTDLRFATLMKTAQKAFKQSEEPDTCAYAITEMMRFEENIPAKFDEAIPLPSEEDILLKISRYLTFVKTGQLPSED